MGATFFVSVLLAAPAHPQRTPQRSEEASFLTIGGMGAVGSLHVAEAYSNKVSAPRKRLIIIEDAGYSALATHQANVIAELNEIVR